MKKVKDTSLAEAHEFLEDKTLTRKDNVVSLELITGGKPPGDGMNWLMALADHTVFAVREKHVGQQLPRYMLSQYIMVKKFAKSALLLSNLNGDQYGMVHPERFCAAFDLHEILYDPLTMPAIEPQSEEEQAKITDETDDERDRPESDK